MWDGRLARPNWRARCPPHKKIYVILAHAIIKEDNQVPDREIDLALTYKNLFILNSEVHTYIEPEEETDEEN